MDVVAACVVVASRVVGGSVVVAAGGGVVVEVGTAVDVQLYEFDCTVLRELADDGQGRHQSARGDEDAVVGTARDQFGKIIEPGGEALDDPQQFEHLEVAGGRLAVRAALRPKLTIEVVEDARGGTNGAPTLAHFGAALPAPAMRC